jgi:hypothetical protein
MDVETTLPQIGADDFARRFSMRAMNLMWLLGAGASASAGIPTAWNMVWEFKQQLFASQRRVSPKTVSDLTNSAIRAQLQAHIDSLGNLPSDGAPDEYAALFEAVYPAEVDRRAYLDAKISGAKPSYGHLALATLMRAQLTRLIWTTNFDPLTADACAKVYDGTGPLTTVALDAPDIASQCINDQRWPIEIKLHGDFRSRRLKNTSEELRHQDQRLRRVLVESCRRFGLIVVGYSGRDSSIMASLEEALNDTDAFPGGLFWLHRGEEPPFAAVEQLLIRASNAGVEAALVHVENFDEVMRDLVRMISGLDMTMLDSFALERRRWSAAPGPVGKTGWPVVRLNALPILGMPSVCRRIVCQIGGYAEAQEAVTSIGANVLVSRTKAGVLAFGTDKDVRAAFTPYGITEFDLHTIETKRLRYDSGERGLLRDALTQAITRQRNLFAVHRRNTDLLAPNDPTEKTWTPLRNLGLSLSGSVAGASGLHWHEGVGIRLDWANDRLWLLIEPRTVFVGITDDNKATAADFARERTVKRYNRQLNALLTFWSELLAGNGDDLRALGIGDGVDAVFHLSHETGFSWRAGS